MIQILQWIYTAFNQKELDSFQIIEFCKDLKINLKDFIKEFKKVSHLINASLNDDILTNVLNPKDKNFYKMCKKDIESRIKKLTDKFEYCLEYEK